MAQSIHDKFTAPHPDFIPEGLEFHFPHVGEGDLFRDYIPEGQTVQEMNNPVEGEPVWVPQGAAIDPIEEERQANKGRKKKSED